MLPEENDREENDRATLALRLAERNRLRAGGGEEAGSPDEPDPAEALADFLRVLTEGFGETAPPGLPAAAASDTVPEPVPDQIRATVVPLARPGQAGASDLDRLPGAGPGIVWVLQREGIGRLADLARLEAGEVAGRLGPLGRLVPLGDWISFAREAGAEA